MGTYRELQLIQIDSKRVNLELWNATPHEGFENIDLYTCHRILRIYHGL